MKPHTTFVLLLMYGFLFYRNDDRSSAEIPQEFIDILASIAEESGTD